MNLIVVFTIGTAFDVDYTRNCETVICDRYGDRRRSHVIAHVMLPSHMTGVIAFPRKLLIIDSLPSSPPLIASLDDLESKRITATMTARSVPVQIYPGKGLGFISMSYLSFDLYSCGVDS